ncbi:MAG TPA: 3-hydroxyacyl-CoA dehydrogenase family protein, partial [Spirochaetota bacterium]|nr:3-hydroxyacyl-CoA dehydrogenase family protein [Spirochaetota bacterium]
INEAVKVFKEGIAGSRKDIDDGVKYGMNAFAGPFTLASGMQPQQITDALNALYQRYKIDMFKPEPEIVDGSFKTLGA